SRTRAAAGCGSEESKKPGCSPGFSQDRSPRRERRASTARLLSDFWAENGLSPLRRNNLQLQASLVGYEKTRQLISIFLHSLKNNGKPHVRLLAKLWCAQSVHARRENNSPITRSANTLRP